MKTFIVVVWLSDKKIPLGSPLKLGPVQLLE